MARRLKSQNNPDGLIELGKWDKGMINLLPAKSIPNDALLNAVNVDISDDGKIQRRKGYTKLSGSAFNVQGVVYRSLTSFNGLMVFLRGSELVACYDTGEQEKVLKTGFSDDSTMCYEELDGQLYCMNMKDNFSCIIDSDFNIRNFGVPQLKGLPTVYASTGGTLFEGRYLITFTVLNSNGEESGSVDKQVLDVPSNGKISIVCNPGLVPTLLDGFAKVNVYLSKANGDIVYKTLTIDATGGFMVDITSDEANGKQLVNELLNPLPVGEILKYYRGRFYSSNGLIVWSSVPYNFGLCDFDDSKSGYMQYSKRVKIMASMQDGMYIVADKTYWLQGTSIDDFNQRVVLPYSAAFGTLSQYENSMDFMWFSDKGWIISSNGGNVKNINDGKVDPGKYESGATIHVRKDGQDKFISSLNNGLGSTAVCNGYFEAEIRRKEI